ncbi:MAG: hypothetical protein LBE91_00060 [Tannerella sp.]|jgi:hypothetical protein|nr:hypothetical protein [Tannerella sp.]
MNRLDLNALGVAEMSQDELISVEGGSIWSAIGDAFEAACEAIGEAWEWVKENTEIVVNGGGQVSTLVPGH